MTPGAASQSAAVTDAAQPVQPDLVDIDYVRLKQETASLQLDASLR